MNEEFAGRSFGPLYTAYNTRRMISAEFGKWRDPGPTSHPPDSFIITRDCSRVGGPRVWRRRRPIAPGSRCSGAGHQQRRPGSVDGYMD